MRSSLIEEVSGSFALITFNRPEKLNSYDLELLVRLHQSIERNSQREDIRVIILSGKGSSFCSGCDISHLHQLLNRNDLKSFRRMEDAVKKIIVLLRRIPQATIASIDGVACDGGLNFALSCDLRIATSRSLFGYPFSQLGWIPETGTRFCLRDLAGSLSSFDLICSGELKSAAEALTIGLINRQVEPTELVRATHETAQRLSLMAPIMIRNLKRSLYQSYQGLEKSIDSETEARIRCFLSDDALEGIESFIENRDPVFKGK